ncbi:MAG: hypothetical protein PHO66_01715 [Eubacteriales bacterium]|nr:hypothetical protein [Eubacteriales bacterium]
MKNKGSIVWGVLLIALGVLLVLSQLGMLDITGRMIPALGFLALALAFHLAFFLSGRRSAGLLVPGGILLVYGGLFLFCALQGYQWMQKLWPLYILGPALGLFEMYAFSGGRTGSMIPVFILTAIGGAFLLGSVTDLSGYVVIGAALMILGLVLFFGAFRRSVDEKSVPPAEPVAQPMPGADQAGQTVTVEEIAVDAPHSAQDDTIGE